MGGFSRGAVVALGAAPGLGADVTGVFSVSGGPSASEGYPSVASVSRYPGPLLLVAARQDPVFPHSTVHRIAARHDGEEQILLVPGDEHALALLDGEHGPVVRRALFTFHLAGVTAPVTGRQPTRTTTSTVTSGEPRPPRWLVTTVVLLLVVLVAFIVIRLLSDLPYLVNNRVPEEGDFARRYVQHPRTAYLHIATGVLFLAGALLQVSYRRRRRAYAAHRLRGRVLVALGWVACGSALAFGLPHAFGGRGEAAATALFGAWMAACLALGLAAARRHDIPAHRRWMVRAFAVALAVGTIRIWLGLLVAAGSLTLRDSFAPAFWLAFSMHVVVAEVWLRRFPPPPDAVDPRRAAPTTTKET